LLGAPEHGARVLVLGRRVDDPLEAGAGLDQVVRRERVHGLGECLSNLLGACRAAVALGAAAELANLRLAIVRTAIEHPLIGHRCRGEVSRALQAHGVLPQAPELHLGGLDVLGIQPS
jgi:hypothetical protein